MAELTDLLSAILTGGIPTQGPLVVLKGMMEDRDETPDRLRYAESLNGWKHGTLSMGWPIIIPAGRHTQEEAHSALALLVHERDIRIVTSGYHQLRAFLTFLAARWDYTTPLPRLWNCPVRPVSLVGLSAELKKIQTYQEKCHCASLAEALAYLREVA